MFGFKKKTAVVPYDREKYQPVIKASICNGEQVAGFKDKESGKFKEIMFLRNEADKHEFMDKYGIVEGEITKEY